MKLKEKRKKIEREIEYLVTSGPLPKVKRELNKILTKLQGTIADLPEVDQEAKTVEPVTTE